jgi:hypothetical protein
LANPRAFVIAELISPEDVTVVRRGQRRHTHLSGGLEQLVDPGSTIEYGVLGAHVRWTKLLSDAGCADIET